MNDRELLEAAAKAAGYWSHEFNCPDKLPRPDWNPLTDDGDALRLLVALDMEIHGGRKPVNFREVLFMLEGDPHSEEIAPYSQDQAAATRRAIVRAAAEIGRQA